MIRADMIPNEVVEATAWAMCDDINGEGAWDETPFRHRPMWRSAARAAIAAALNAWPGVKPHEVQVPDDTSDDIRYVLKTVGIILPLPQKEGDA